ncbi:MAG: HEPN domain-containing protein [Bacteroidales bacterium]|nr:HEPN domain-containing protein [Bacteroidales bacterium]
MSLSNEERKDIVIYRTEKSYKAFEQARLNAGIKCWEVVASRLYYSAYYAVSALLIAEGYTTKTHEGIINSFSLHFIKEGLVPKEMGRLYRNLFALRLSGGYEDHFDAEEADVVPLIEPTKQLIDFIITKARNKMNV